MSCLKNVHMLEEQVVSSVWSAGSSVQMMGLMEA